MTSPQTDLSTARGFGALLLTGIVFGVLSSVPALEYPDYLVKLPTLETQVLVAVFAQAAMALTYAWIAALTHRLVKRYDPGLATAYLGLRMVGSGFLFVGIASLLLLLWFSQNALSVDAAAPSYVQITGELLRRGRDMLNHIGMILPWSIGGLILYYSFYKTKLVPRWLSVWGGIGSAATLVATILLMLNIIEMATPAYFVMNTPLALLEVTLAVFLLAKGFRARPPSSEATSFS